MKYYKLSKVIDKLDEIGKYPQVETMFQLGDIDYVYEIKRHNPYYENWQIPEPILHTKAKPTTLIDGGYISPLIFLILKDSFIPFLKEFNIADFQTWAIKVHHNKEILYEYVLFHLSYPNDSTLIDYSNSKFLIGKLGDWKNPNIRTPIQIENNQTYINIKEVLKESNNKSQIRCEKLILNLKHFNNDLFRLIDVPFGLGYYASERLKNAIEEKGFTGFAFQEIEEMDERITAIY